MLNFPPHSLKTVEHDFGKRLTQARLARGVTVEEAAQATHMRPPMIRALEDGNLSQFPNAAYAKSFLLMYARYLRIDIEDAAAVIDTSTQMRVEDFQYLTSRASEEKRLQRDATDTRYDFVVPQKTGGSWLPLIIILVLLAIGGAGFMIWNNLNRLDQRTSDASTPAPVAEANPGDSNVEKPSPVPPGKEIPVPPVVVSTPGSPPANSLEPAPGEHPTAAIAGTPPARVETPGPAFSTTPPGPEETTAVPLEPGTIILEPHRKTWVTIRTGPGGQPLYEDYLYPTAKAMHLPAGRYFIELKDAAGVEISKDGKVIAYTSPGVLVE
jgi:cytoskeleton protein RodZ